MIRESKKRSDMAHAIGIQQRRVDAGKRGYAKAIRRWLKHVIDTTHTIKMLPVLGKHKQPAESETA